MDIQVLYPNQSTIKEKSERREPEFYNYMCVHGKQLFIRVSRKYYQVLTAGWYPSFADKSRYIFTDRFHIIYASDDFFSAMNYFQKCANELVPYCNYGQLEF